MRSATTMRAAELAGQPFRLPDFFAKMNLSGTIPFELIESEMVPSSSIRGTPQLPP